MGLVVTALAIGVGGDGPLVRLDERITDRASSWVASRTWAITLFEGVTFLGATVFLVVVVGLAAGLLWRPDRSRAVAFLVVAAATSTLLNAAVKSAVDRPRPAEGGRLASTSGASFTSGHALGATVVFGAVVMVLWPLLPLAARRPLLVTTVLGVGAVGISRVVLGVHYPTDVIGGHLLGLAWLAGWAALIIPRWWGRGSG
ncbi:hypothetical protein BH23ACT2_BH23ACT2_11980 [soil metagenome]